MRRPDSTARTAKHFPSLNTFRRALSFITPLGFGYLLVVSGLPNADAANRKTMEKQAPSGVERVKLGLNKALVLDIPTDASDILVGNPSVADAVMRTARRVYLFGKQVGETNIFVFDANQEQVANINLVVERDVTGLEAYLKRFIPNSKISVELLNDNVVLSGNVETPMDASRAVNLAEIFVSGGEATTGQYSQTASGGSSESGVAIDNPDSERRESKIVNLLAISGEDQVTLKVTVAEISRVVMKQLGVNLSASGTSSGISWGAVSDNPYGLGKPLSGSSFSISTSALDASINAMEQAGVMKTLAEPTLTAISGEKATFRVGGDYNIVSNASTSDGKTDYSIEKVEYGIGLEFQPVVLSAGRISLKIRTQVSEPTLEGSSSTSGSSTDDGSGSKSYTPGSNILSIRKRLADTTVELPSGGSMMIAGLVRDDVRQAVSGYPGLSKIPVLGTLFRSRDFVRNETELVIIVTPYLVRPVPVSELSKPDDNFGAAGDTAAMFMGKVNRLYGGSDAKVPDQKYHGTIGYIYK
ncbi:MAG: type II and III secretion system protein family protein [Mesorhizobium sp.]|nr:MAG: type II and III secretion system protein family protein [Mesorhizobium sp.]RWC45524.1 MAG: type II and III secretion system protein family protein [Mesorhizobium sp.]RWD26239.1 MAG: type II and III secretion system protein family protein [Mesorhizobium sp.]RWE91035.1 MAG: type II and III secretion system protein family protein [Mesorhizobium sp.]RWE95035.1 MAG: type II and III secretion system protein family protein [Mesorhizobium sp.]